jgi:excisionase family DNA binding protein
MMLDGEEVLSESQAAVVLGTTTRKLRRLRAEGKIRYTRVGKTPVYMRSFLDEYLKRQEVRPARRA